MRKIAIGFRVHSGWAMMVAVAGSPDRPVIVDRLRIQFSDTAQPYHAARDLGAIRGRVFLEECRKASNALTASALEAAVKRMGGDRVQGCAVLMGSGRVSATLEATLASHAAIHTAEGVFFREVVIAAAQYCGLQVSQIKEKELFDLAAREFQASVEDLMRGLNELSRVVGPPWTQDHKYAALAGWLAL